MRSASLMWVSLLSVVPVTVSAVDVIIFGGQSNAGMGGQCGVVFDRQLYPKRVLAFRGGRSQYGSTPVVKSRLTAIVGANDRAGLFGEVGHFPATLTGFAIEGRNKLDGTISPGYLMRTDWYGGKSIMSFIPGTVAWDNLMVSASHTVATLRKLGKEARVAAYVWIQGESGPSGREHYRRLLQNYADLTLSSIQAQAKQTQRPHFILVQTNMPDAGRVRASGVELGQLDYARAMLGRGVSLAGPSYQLPLCDNIHNSAIGRMMQADLLAIVYQKVVRRGQVFQPLMPASIRRYGHLIDVRFFVPAGPLAFDEAWIKPATNYGFSYSDDDGATSIKRVEIISKDTVRITLDRIPTGGEQRVSYAQNTDDIQDGWAGGRGQLISPTNKEATYFKLGFDVPEIVNHYAVRFDEPVM